MGRTRGVRRRPALATGRHTDPPARRSPTRAVAIAERGAELAHGDAAVDPPAVLQHDMAIGVGRALDGSACRRPVLPPVEVSKRLLVDRRCMERLQAEPGVPALLVRLQEETEVIGLEPLGATQVARLEPGNAAAHLAEQELFGVARE